MLALDFENGGRRSGVGTGLLRGNAVNEECERVTALINPAFAINTIVDDHGAVEHVFAGHWRAAHERACESYAAAHSATLREKRDLVIVSCGGLPYDLNMIQAHKALDMAAHACADGGTIILLAECSDGLGRPDFLKWFESENSRALELHLRETLRSEWADGLGVVDQGRKFSRTRCDRTG
jgi:nickel-dependent lactate racemase